MAANVTLAELIARARFEADMVNSTQASDADITRQINKYVTDFYDMLVEAGVPDYYLASTTINTVAGQVDYSLPSNFRSLLGVYSDDNGRSRQVFAVKQGELSRYKAPQGAYALTVEYVPTPTQLVNPADTLDGVSGWDEYVVLLTARQLLRRQRRDVASLEQAIAEQRARIMTACTKRDQSGPRYVNDVTEARSWPFYGAMQSVDAYRLVNSTLRLYCTSPDWP